MRVENARVPLAPAGQRPLRYTHLSTLRAETNIGTKMKPAERWRSVAGLRLVHSTRRRSDPIQPKNSPSATAHQDPSLTTTAHEITPLGYHLLKGNDYSFCHRFGEQRIKFCGIQLIRYSSPNGNAFGHSGRISYTAGERLTDRLVDAVRASSKK